jgi:hypothetical protein
MAVGCSPAASNGTASTQTGLGALLQPASTAGAGMSTFTDPTENAFTVSAPQGWTVKGGVQRTSPAIAQTWLTATSPDGATTVTIGDPSIPSFILPNSQHAAGSTAQNAAGTTSPVEPYENSVQFAGDYAQRVYGSVCAPLTPAGSQAEPGLVQIVDAQTQKMAAALGVQAPPSSIYDGGSATFTCQAGGVADAVGVMDVTTLMQTQFGGSWSVPLVMSYRTPAAGQAQTDQMVRAMRQSYQPNAQWQAQMAQAGKQQLAVLQQQGAQGMAALQSQEASESAMLSAQAQASNARLNAEHAATMAQLNAQGQRINQNFAAQQYNKATGQQAEMRYINNQTCVQWADAAHTRCAVTGPN